MIARAIFRAGQTPSSTSQQFASSSAAIPARTWSCVLCAAGSGSSSSGSLARCAGVPGPSARPGAAKGAAVPYGMNRIIWRGRLLKFPPPTAP